MENILELMKSRHSVRSYLDKPLPEDVIKKLQDEINEVNAESGLSFKLVVDDKKAFKSFIPKYGIFKNVSNYIICSGIKKPAFEELYGYFGERLVLFAQSLGLNTCWVGLTVNKRVVKQHLEKGERLGCVIALGYGATQGVAHKNHDVNKITSTPSPWPEWFHDGVMGAMLAPTAVNRQGFKINLNPDGKVSIKSTTNGPFSQVDLGIVKYQFKEAAGKDFPGFA